jgi:hypothetical protein
VWTHRLAFTLLHAYDKARWMKEDWTPRQGKAIHALGGDVRGLTGSKPSMRSGGGGCLAECRRSAAL